MLSGFGHHPTRAQPPIDDPRVRLRRELLPTEVPEESEPEFPAEHTARKEVVNRFRYLGAQGAPITVLKAMPKPPVHRPGATVMHRPKEETTFPWCLHFPKLFSAQNASLIEEHSRISRARRIQARRAPPPNQTIIYVRVQPDGVHSLADLQVLHHDRQSAWPLHILNPGILIKGRFNRATFLSMLRHRSGKVWRKLRYGAAIQPMVSPKAQLVTIPQDHTCGGVEEDGSCPVLGAVQRRPAAAQVRKLESKPMKPERLAQELRVQDPEVSELQVPLNPALSHQTLPALHRVYAGPEKTLHNLFYHLEKSRRQP
jgi:hypothetical protein